MLVIEDLAMAFYLPILTALLVGMDLGVGTIARPHRAGGGLRHPLRRLRHGALVSRLVWSKERRGAPPVGAGPHLLVAGVAARSTSSAAVGAFLVGIAISGPVAEHAGRVLSPLRDLFAAVFFLFFGLSTDPRDLVSMLIPARASSRW